MRLVALLRTIRRRRSELRPLLRAAWMLPVVTRRLQATGGRAVSDTNVLQARQHRVSTHQSQRAQRLSRVVQLVAHRGWVEGTCLSRSLVLLDLMQREGIPGVLRIGVRLPGEAVLSLEAHAWVECGNLALNDRTDAVGSFNPFAVSHAHASTSGDRA
ncbi:MAG: lasso peptide biosynthesis B2 protein [Gemmatimonas sp.]